MCECHTNDDKIVLFNGLNTHGYRIRFRLAKQVEHDRIHNHRFTAIHHIINGNFSQQYFGPKKELNELNSIDDFEFKYNTEHGSGESFEVNFKDFHTSRTSKGTVSLLLRGPVKNTQAICFNYTDNSVRVRRGFANSRRTENSEHLMSRSMFKRWVNTLVERQVIDSIKI